MSNIFFKCLNIIVEKHKQQFSIKLLGHPVCRILTVRYEPKQKKTVLKCFIKSF